MPFVEVDGPSGPWNFCYIITTPTKISAENIDPDAPTIVFIHSVYITKEAFERQFDNPLLRQFNLVTFDLRGYGETGGSISQDPFLPSHITDDVCNILDALKLPPCHIFGLSLGYYSSLDLAARRPEKILSVTVCSPLPPVELEEVLQARLQVVQNYTKLFRGKVEGNISFEDLAEDVTLGVGQFMFNLTHTSMLHAVVRLFWDYCLRARPIHIDSVVKRTYGVFRDQIPLTKDHLAKIQCPVTIIHCTEDVAYKVDVANDLRTTLLDAGVRVQPVLQVPGAHYGCITHPEQFVCSEILIKLSS
ncbi:hypothetical protein AX15_000495 [Amanita polypyramis BW_CC]|nr:hypothetical protein AX15_000495 [Amanita polypyramis BW_CC]